MTVSADETAQPLRGHLVRRLPSRAERTGRKAFVLTPRDSEILVAVATQGVLTTDLVALAFFPVGEESDHTPSSRAYERLRRLWLWGYLERTELPVARVLGGRRPFLYTLGSRAVAPVSAALGTETAPIQRRRLDRVYDLFVDHELRIATFWAYLTALLRGRGDATLRWTPERDLRARRLQVPDPRTGQPLPFLLDALFELESADGGIQTCLLEVDLGTLSLPRFRRKLRAFEAGLAHGLLARHWGRRCFVVRVLTDSRARLRHLWQAARLEVPRERWADYSLATRDILAPRRFGESVWVTLTNEIVPLLKDARRGPPDERCDTASPSGGPVLARERS